MINSRTSIALALTAALGASTAALADDNPFGMQTLDHGYLLADANTKAEDGKCGEGKCGAETEAKAKDGKCGEGKCGADKKTADSKAQDGKCGEGKCGAGSADGDE
jgi:uncharacterized low-complexity protein